MKKISKRYRKKGVSLKITKSENGKRVPRINKK